MTTETALLDPRLRGDDTGLRLRLRPVNAKKHSQPTFVA